MQKLLIVFLLPLVTAFSCGPYLRSNDVASLVVGHSGKSDLLASDEAVDRLATDVAQLLADHGFIIKDKSQSFGLQPFTGHTQNIWLRLAESERIFGYVSISKCCIEVVFRELETEIGSGIYNTTQQQREQINAARALVEEYVFNRTKGVHGLNQSFQGTFDPPVTFAVAKVPVASNAPELRRQGLVRSRQ